MVKKSAGTQTRSNLEGNYPKATRNKKIHKQIELWKPRNIIIGVDIPEFGEPDEFISNTPERTAVQLIDYWKRNNYGFIAKQLYQPFKDLRSENEEIKNVRRILEDKKLVAYKIINIDDKAPAICEVIMNVQYEYRGVVIKQDITLRLICQRENGDTSMFGDENGRWYCISKFLYDIDGKSLEAIINMSNKVN